MSTVNVTIKAIDQKGNPIANAIVTARLSNLEVNATAGYVVAEKTSVVANEFGIAVMALYPNELGSTESMYDFTIKNPDTGQVEKIQATIPNQNCFLHEVAYLPPYPGKTDGQLIIDEAIAAVAPAIAAKVAAEAAAAIAVQAAEDAQVVVGFDVEIGTVETGEVAQATMSGTVPDRILNLVLPKGDQGEQGIQGLPGQDGTNGINGTNGTDGADGQSAYELALANGFVGTLPQWLDSLKGEQGEQGLPGIDGTNGINGTNGVDGQDGLSAYQIALNNGFVGTEAQWLASLEGPQGPQGEQGPVGPSGSDVSISNEGTLLTSAVTSINFVGSGVNTTNTGSAVVVTVNSGVTSVTTTAPIVSSGGATPNISMAAASSGVGGYLSGTDWVTFNNKQAALGYTPANKAGDTFTGPVTISSVTPVLNFVETDQALPAGKFRLVVNGDIVYLQKNTAAAGDFSTAIIVWGTDVSGGLTTTTPATSDNDTSVATTAYVVARILQDALSKSGGTINGNLSFIAASPTLSFYENDVGAPAGRFRLRMEGDQAYYEKNTAVAADFSTVIVGWRVNTFGELLTTTPAVGTDSTVVATTAYTVARIAQDAPTKTGSGASGSWGISVTGNAANVTGIVAGANGGTGVDNSGKTITLGGNLTTSGAFASIFTMTGATTVTFPTSGTLGYLNIPQNSQSAAYTLVLADAGKHLLHPSADTTARTFTIPANASVAFPIGTAISFINQNGGGAITIAITSDVMRLAGAGTTGSRSLAANGIATAIKVTATEWLISGVGLT